MAYLSFISDEDLFKHIHYTLSTYSETLKSIDLKKFNANLIDPIKFTFDSIVYKKDVEEIIKEELFRQRDKTNTNAIGYFHQNIFKYIENCEVPLHGFDVIFKNPNTNRKIYVEMKNKHNTMNSSASQRTYIKLSNALINNPKDESFLVEVIAKRSQNVPWALTIDNQKMCSEKIRRVSIDKFYEIVTGEANSFYNLCNILPHVIKEIVNDQTSLCVEEDTVFDELQQNNTDLLKALYLLAFETYEGFSSLK